MTEKATEEKEHEKPYIIENKEIERDSKRQRTEEADKVNSRIKNECYENIKSMEYELESDIWQHNQNMLFIFDMEGDKLGIGAKCPVCRQTAIKNLIEEIKKGLHMVVLRSFKLYRTFNMIKKTYEGEMLETMTNLKNEEFANCLYTNLNGASIIGDSITKIKNEFPATYIENKELMKEVEKEIMESINMMTDMQTCIKDED